MICLVIAIKNYDELQSTWLQLDRRPKLLIANDYSNREGDQDTGLRFLVHQERFFTHGIKSEKPIFFTKIRRFPSL